MTRAKETQVIITIGSGGVGKTTVASVLGLHHAQQGERVLVITVDPARRLLDAMAVTGDFDEPCRVHMPSLDASAGELFIFMPNLKKEWADFLEAAITHREKRRSIASNHFYRYMADGMPGAFEIICSHVLFRLMKSGHYDKIILDTPPTSHSISFFDVPKKIANVLERSVFRALMSNQNSIFRKLTKKIALFSGGILENTFERIIGSHFLSELIEFAISIDALYEPLLHRVRAMDQLLSLSTTSYALVIRPTSASVNDSAYLREALMARGIAIHQVIVNQVMPLVDHLKAAEELTTLPMHDDNATISQLLAIYVKELACENRLIERTKKLFPHAHTTRLYLTDAALNRSEMLERLEHDLSHKGT